MRAEAEAEQIPDLRSEWHEVSLVRVAVLERVVVQRFRADRRDAEPGDVRGERDRERAHVRMRRAEIGHVAVAERVLGRAVGMSSGEGTVVQEDRPRSDGETASHRGRK